MRIIFMGTPEFAVPSLCALCDRGWDVALVVTQPDSPKGRGRKIAPPPVKVEALKRGLSVIQPASVKGEEFAGTLEKLGADYLAVAAYGRILPPRVLAAAKIAPVNVHPSLLPKYRGPAPIPWALLNGDRETGVTIMCINDVMDSGDILLVEREAILDTDTGQTLHDRLARKGGALLVKAMEQLAGGGIAPQAQDHSLATYAPMLKKENGLMDWTKPAAFLDRLVRAMTPWPGAFTRIEGQRANVYAVRTIPETTGAAPGTVLSGTGKKILVATGQGVLEILEIQSPSGKRLRAAEYTCGRPICPGTVLG